MQLSVKDMQLPKHSRSKEIKWGGISIFVFSESLKFVHKSVDYVRKFVYKNVADRCNLVSKLADFLSTITHNGC